MSNVSTVVALLETVVAPIILTLSPVEVDSLSLWGVHDRATRLCKAVDKHTMSG